MARPRSLPSACACILPVGQGTTHTASAPSRVDGRLRPITSHSLRVNNEHEHVTICAGIGDVYQDGRDKMDATMSSLDERPLCQEEDGCVGGMCSHL